MHFRVYRMKAAARETFRWSAHTSGHCIVKRNDYDAAEEIQASSEYDAWQKLNALGARLFPGDLLEQQCEQFTTPDLKVVKYIGFEPASWWVPAAKTTAVQDAASSHLPNCPEFPTQL